MEGNNNTRYLRGYETTKIRILAISTMLRFDRPITAQQILRNLECRYGITCDRKTIYSDMCAIDRFTPIAALPGRKGGYIRVDVLRGCEDG